MNPIVDIVFLCHDACQLDLDGFQPFAFTNGSRLTAIGLPVGFPTVILDVGLIFDASGVFLIAQIDVDTFKP